MVVVVNENYFISLVLIVVYCIQVMLGYQYYFLYYIQLFFCWVINEIQFYLYFQFFSLKIEIYVCVYNMGIFFIRNEELKIMGF